MCGPPTEYVDPQKAELAALVARAEAAEAERDRLAAELAELDSLRSTVKRAGDPEAQAGEQ